MIALQAQTEHLKFMGIPLNGTITQFQAKLTAKGIKPNSELNKRLGVGCRAFTGTFSGEKAEFFVYYNDRTKIVYRAKAVIECMDGEKGEMKQKDFKDLLNRKYPGAFSEQGEQDGHPTFMLLLPNSQNNYLGSIGLYISNSGYSFIDTVSLHIDYTDGTNAAANENNNMDDL